MRARKQDLRRLVWNALREARVARFPGARGRVPNFTGAEAAADRLARWPSFQRARTILCSHDLAQRPVRVAALRAGKVVYAAVPRLEDERPFLELDPARLDPGELWEASSIRGAAQRARPVSLDELRPVDLVVIGSVAVDPSGARLGRGGGYGDLEYALLREAGRIGARTRVVTTVHPLQVRRRGQVPMLAHDVAVDAYFLPTGRRDCERNHRRPGGVDWGALDPDLRAAIPSLQALAPAEARPDRGRRRRRSGRAARGPPASTG